MQLPGSATLTGPVSWAGLFVVTRLRLNHLLTQRHFGRVGLASLVLSYWEEPRIDRNRPGLLRSELRSRRTLIVEQTNR